MLQFKLMFVKFAVTKVILNEAFDHISGRLVLVVVVVGKSNGPIDMFRFEKLKRNRTGGLRKMHHFLHSLISDNLKF